MGNENHQIGRRARVVAFRRARRFRGEGRGDEGQVANAMSDHARPACLILPPAI